ncbi:MAG: capsid cement protein [Verrucomicrobiota bacterium]
MNPLHSLLTRLFPRAAHFANVAEGTHEGAFTSKTDAAIATRYLLAKDGSDDSHVAVCGASDIPLGVMTDEAEAAEDLIAVEVLGVSKRTLLMVASEAIDRGEHVYTAASGKVQDLPAGAGTYYEVGVALTAASADGDLIEVAHCVPRKTIVT